MQGWARRRGWGRDVHVRTGGACQEPGDASATKNTSVVTKSLSPLGCASPVQAAGSPCLSAWTDLPVLDKTTSFSLDR